MFCTTVYVELNFRDFGLTNWLAQAGNEELCMKVISTKPSAALKKIKTVHSIK